MKIRMLILGMLVSAAAAAQQAPPPDEIMATHDGNGDGEITKAEASAVETPLAMFFDQIDTNMDGKITMAELMSMGPPG